MKYSIAVAISAIGLFALTGNAFAAGKSCDDLKSEIQAKIEANHVPHFALKVVDKGADAGGSWKVVGTCGGGTKEILYSKNPADVDAANNAAPADSAAPAPAK